ncbi:DUF86 domain-containing protein [bacterium]|nr:DUF86 domain-containing protein [bacterium]
MFDKELVLDVLTQIKMATETILERFKPITKVSDFTDSPRGMEKLDAICMLLIAIGESLKKIDKLTNDELLTKYDQIDWKGAKGMRDIISHHYFDIDAEEIYWVCEHRLLPLSEIITKIIEDLQ